MIDNHKHKGLRKILTANLSNKGIRSPDVLNAINTIPRHFFMDKDFEEHAYIDKAFPIGSNQTISQPYTVAFQTTILDVKKSEKVLEIGTGSGYQTAILVFLKAKVFTIERQFELFRKSKQKLHQLGLMPEKIKYGDGFLGMKECGPFDKIIITAGAKKIPTEVLSQLKVGGKMIVPIGDVVQKMISIYRESEKRFIKKEHGEFRFVPMLRKTN